MKMTQSELLKILHRNPDIMQFDEDRRTTPRHADPTIDDDINAHPARFQTEHDFQVAVIRECDRRAERVPAYGDIFAIPNGGSRHPAVAGKLKAEGVRPGIPDLFLPVKRRHFGGLYIELKITPNKPSVVQKKVITRLRRNGYMVCVIWDSMEDALDAIKWYIEVL